MARRTREQSQALPREKLLLSAGDVVARYSYDGASVERIA
ncbi:AcrR family transcriptional regulator [Arthrobacter pascens]|nr:AcrR family transcriptional regulator [Arthrobacter pascens]